MTESKMSPKLPHHIVVEERKDVSIAGVIEVLSFDENNVLMETSLGELLIRGYNLHITKTDVETGELVLNGEIAELIYNTKQRNGSGVWGRLFHNA